LRYVGFDGDGFGDGDFVVAARINENGREDHEDNADSDDVGIQLFWTEQSIYVFLRRHALMILRHFDKIRCQIALSR